MEKGKRRERVGERDEVPDLGPSGVVAGFRGLVRSRGTRLVSGVPCIHTFRRKVRRHDFRVPHRFLCLRVPGTRPLKYRFHPVTLQLCHFYKFL